jgi:murein lipoprotein
MEMKMNKKIKYVFTVTTLSALVALSGCATTGQLEEVKSQLNAVQQDASSAKSEAAAARASANEAKDIANRALNTANEANSRSMQTEEKIDRMFKKSMYK